MSATSSQDAPTWFVARTNPKCEERALAGLVAAGFHAYLPHGSKFIRRRYTKSRRRVQFPLLTGYVFVGLTPWTPNFFDLRRVDGVSSILGAAGRPIAIPAATVDEFRELEAAGTFAEGSIVKPFGQGERVMIHAGPLRGAVVHFDDQTGRKSARVIARLFGQVRPVSIALSSLSKMDAAHE